MNSKISKRKQFLTERKNAGNRLTIGFTGIADLRSFIGFEYMAGMLKAATDYDINFINMGGAVKYSLFDDINFISHYKKKFKFMKPPFIDGLVIWASSLWEFLKEPEIIQLFSSLSPLPMVDIGHMDIPGVSMLRINTNTAIEFLMEHLIKVHNYKRFAFIGANVSEPHKRRLLTYQKELKKYGLKELDNSVYMAKSMSSKHLAEVVDELLSNYNLSNKEEIDAIVTTTDVIATEVIELLSQKGISVPKDVAITGFNNWYEGIIARSPLTTIDLSYFKRGYAAVELLIDRIVFPEEEVKTIYFPTNLVVRQSCGCFENSVIESSSTNSKINFDYAKQDSEDNTRFYLLKELKQILPFLTEEKIIDFMDCLFSDLYDSADKKNILVWFQNILQDYRKFNDFDGELFQNIISNLRTITLPLLANEDYTTIFHIENIFHQMRSLVSVFQKYESLADRENPYRVNNITEQAVSFTSVKKIEDIYEVLKYQLSQLNIPSVILALSNSMSTTLQPTEIKFVFPEQKKNSNKINNETIFEPHLFSKEYFPQNKRYSVMLEILHHADNYFGYAFFEMKSLNIANYDVLKMLLSNALYSVYQKEHKIEDKTISLTTEQIDSILDIKVLDNHNSRERISVKKIKDYLVNHIGEMTNLDKMAEELMVSKSYLSKKTKELTGYSIQTLHEKLKIEQAKNMLILNNYELSEIANALGFKEQTYFSNVFKKNTGVSPKNWLKQRN